jgi:hypothetical protein
MVGMRMSISTTSTRRRRTCSMASAPLLASPTISMSADACRIMRSPDRTSSSSSTSRTRVVGSDIAMDDLGMHSLKGVDGSWQLFVARP